MKVGDLVRYVPMHELEGSFAALKPTQRSGIIVGTGRGIIVAISESGYYSVLWVDGERQEDLVYSELEVISHG